MIICVTTYTVEPGLFGLIGTRQSSPDNQVQIIVNMNINEEQKLIKLRKRLLIMKQNI